MLQNDTDKPETLRSAINAVRRRNGLIKMTILVVPIGLIICWLSSGHPEYGEYFIILMFAYLVISFLVDLSDVCPRCNHNISKLKDEGHFLLPKLSHQVHVCPFCGVDLDSRILLPSNASPSESSLVNTGGKPQSNDGNNKSLTSHLTE